VTLLAPLNLSRTVGIQFAGSRARWCCCWIAFRRRGKFTSKRAYHCVLFEHVTAGPHQHPHASLRWLPSSSSCHPPVDSREDRHADKVIRVLRRQLPVDIHAQSRLVARMQEAVRERVGMREYGIAVRRVTHVFLQSEVRNRQVEMQRGDGGLALYGGPQALQVAVGKPAPLSTP
jgi:hypothetical protein